MLPAEVTYVSRNVEEEEQGLTNLGNHRLSL